MFNLQKNDWPKTMEITAEYVRQALQNSSWIRRMFEVGASLKAQYGEDNVFDLSLGNPVLEPPPAVQQALLNLLSKPSRGMYRYPPNAGLPATREAVAQWLVKKTGIAHRMEHVLLTCGAAGALNVILKALLNPMDEVLAFRPFFPEYALYAANHGGVLRVLPCDTRFQPNLEALERALSPKVRALIINSPNNPSGVVYSGQQLAKIAQLLEKAGQVHGRPIFLLSDEPYRQLVFDGVTLPWPTKFYPHTALIASHSKDLGLAGGRIGWIALHPEAAQASALSEAMVWANRVLGFVNAPVLLQRILPEVLDAKVDVAYYENLRNLAVAALRAAQYEVVMPQGAFFVFPKSPIQDDVAFTKRAQNERLLFAPGSGFGLPGYFRLSLSVSRNTLQGALPLFAKLR